MEVLKPGLDLEAFWTRLGLAERRALLLDYDGTLAPFRVERDRAEPYPGVREILERIAEGGRTRVVVISGRVAAEVRSLLGLRIPLEVWGAHGWERFWPDGRYELGSVPASVREGLRIAGDVVGELGAEQQLERKPSGLAFHVRGLPDHLAREWRERVRAGWAALADEVGLELHDFDGGVELSAPGRNKGYAVSMVLGELGADAVNAYLGDDATDEDAFAQMGSHGLTVLVRPEPRPTAAALWIRPPVELREFLGRWAVVDKEKTWRTE
jgi:trehalose 6-phosphate phosphatase